MHAEYPFGWISGAWKSALCASPGFFVFMSGTCFPVSFYRKNFLSALIKLTSQSIPGGGIFFMGDAVCRQTDGKGDKR